MPYTRSLIAFFLIMLGLGLWVILPVPLQLVPTAIWPFSHAVRIYPAALPLIGVPFGAGLAIAWLERSALRSRPPSPPPPPWQSPETGSVSAATTGVVLAVASVLLIVAVQQRAVSPLPAVLVLICGTAALLTLGAALRGLAKGEAISMESHWGGLGGSMGGWHISATAVTLLLALLLFTTTVAVGVYQPEKDEEDQTKTTGTTSAAVPPRPGTPVKPDAGTPEKADTGTPAKPGTDAPVKPGTAIPAKPGAKPVGNAAPAAGAGR